MNVRALSDQEFIRVKVIPNAAKTEIREIGDNQIKIALHAPAREGAANKELIRFLKKQGINVRIVKGLKSKEKLLSIERKSQKDQ